MGLALEEPKENEKTVQINEVEVLMDERVKPFTSGQILDYIQFRGEKGFVFTPATGGGCR